jgi:mevalonate kinase
VERGPDSRARSVGIGRAHAKAILLGEHAVVYGAPALAVPIPQLAATASASRWAAVPHTSGAGGGGVSFTMTGSLTRTTAPQVLDGLRRLTAAFKAHTGVTDDAHLDVTVGGAVPPGRGLGSSAATSRAIVLALADLFERELTDSAAFDLVQTAENMAHGKASGVDAMAVGARAPLRFRAGQARALHIGCDSVLVVADSGTAGSTKEAVGRLREGFEREEGAQDRFVRRATELVDTAVTALAAGQPRLLGIQLTEYHELLRTAGLSTGPIDAMVAAALDAGSLGAKITGGGLGGCMVALTRPEHAGQVSGRLQEAGAARTWVVPLRRNTDHG